MRIPRLWVDSDLTPGMRLIIRDDRAHYLRNVLRLEAGRVIELFNGRDDQSCRGVIGTVGKTITVDLESCESESKESVLHITLIQAIGRSDSIDFIVQKATELGASSILMFNSERTQTPLKPARVEKKIAHWRSVAISACEQCQRNLLPQINFFPSLPDALKPVEHTAGILLDFDGEGFQSIQQSMARPSRVAIAVGPEGGFNAEEIGMINKAGFLSCRVGPRVLRLETAAISAITLTQHYLGDL